MTNTPAFNRLALSPAEAAQALGISLAAFEREVLPSVAGIDLDGQTVIPVQRLEDWLQHRTSQVRRGALIQTKNGRRA